MSARVILLATLAALALPSACADGAAASALAADDECAAGDAACDLSLRQLRVHASADQAEKKESAATVATAKATPWKCDKCENFAGRWKGQTAKGWVTSTQTQDGCVGKVTVAGLNGNVGLCGHHMTTDFPNGNQCEMMNDKTNLVCTDGTKWQKQSSYR
mmetsp:Transcript_113780/g.368141  ORF Transcript_113780/g.368141 Transcript_113780/m.368141 type:complete len:160 (-) Transcript_113780:144-623(-)